MIFTNIACALGHELLLEANTFKDDVKDKYKKRENKLLKENEVTLTYNDIKISYKSVDEAIQVYEVLENMKGYMQNLTEIVTEIQTKERTFESDLKSGVYNFIVFFTDKPTDIQKIAAFEQQSGFKIMLSTKKEEAKKVGANFPGIYCYNAEEKNAYTMDLPMSLHNISNAILLKSFDKIGADNIRLFQSWEKKMIYFINNKDASFEDDAKRFSTITKKYTTEAKVLHFKPEDVPLLDKLLKLKDSDYPVMVTLEDKAKYAVKGVTEANMEQGLKDLIAGKAPKVTFASEIPADNDTKLVKVLNTDTISKERVDTKKDKFIVFTSPNCGHCKNLKPVLDQLSQALKDKKVEIDFFDYNTIENEPLEDIKIEGVPAIFFKQKGKKDMIKVEGKRSVAELLTYVSENGVSAKVNTADYPELMPKKEETKKDEKKEEKPVEDKPTL